MKCPSCGYPKLIVIETRERDDHIYRRKECFKCEKRVTTKEYFAVKIPFTNTLASSDCIEQQS